MKKVPFVITIATLYALFFQIAPYIGVPDQIIFGMFLFSPCVILYMAYVILKYGKPSPYTFEERFYDDFNYIRNGREEMNAENFHIGHL
ncbi:MAG: hypothetical protein ACXVNN_08255 [Bacteroidia bacterium]